MSTWQRYLIFQIPGWLIAAAVLLGLLHWEFLPPWLGVVGFFAWVLKDVMLYPLLHRAYQTNVKTGLQALVGARGFAHDDLSPKGFVRVQGELWSAQSASRRSDDRRRYRGGDRERRAHDRLCSYSRPRSKVLERRLTKTNFPPLRGAKFIRKRRGLEDLQRTNSPRTNCVDRRSGITAILAYPINIAPLLVIRTEIC